MLLRLALSNIKNHLRDYVVLLTGLVMSSAIFYMFANLATNEGFIKANANFKFASPVFIFGEVLLVIITFVYVMYANSFLLNMRLHDYGLFMMLGAKKRRVGSLMVFETMTVGIIATALGLLLGVGLTGGISQLLFNHLGLEIHKFNPVYFKAILTTILLYLILFFIAALFNLQSLVRKPVLKLLKQTDTVDRIKINPIGLLFSGVAGIVLVGIGYYALAKIMDLQLSAIPIALVTIVVGSFLIFRSSMTLIIHWLKNSGFAQRKLNNFTLSQIMFRIRDYNKILTITSLLFALALGAITVGSAFNREIDSSAKLQSAYTMELNNPTPKEKQLINKLTDVQVTSYDQKFANSHVYYNEDQFEQHPYYTVKFDATTAHPGEAKRVKTTLNDLKTNVSHSMDFIGLGGSRIDTTPQFYPTAKFDQLNGEKGTVSLITVKNIGENRNTLQKLYDMQNSAHPLPDEFASGVGTYPAYLVLSGIYGGLEFIGYFLGIAFLAMLASCLMFKILSGTRQDTVRYNLLNKVGTRRSLMKKSINNEIFVLFALPGILGVIDVLFGLQMFKPLLHDPYYHIQYPIIIFVVVYLIYYLLTTWIYKLIVLPKKK
ncbi:FtsX-like permease family protein [Pediococcus acidilactici]|uniref:FtsX-like permease family protein n=1 Tax=Pediococcus acidilactici TaxID=1254 RepID=UPI0011087645|nr:FtsX-like permease family protein [Pediococcus acidilactici]KAF0344015.1 FtsX-like permease family protein [Pediococcus acidilactici]TLP99970.1 FtsX-like permease family protein [Pediococcus acidilactici]